MMLSEKGKAFLQLHISVLLAGFTGLFGRLVSLDAAQLSWWRMLLTTLILVVFIGFPRIPLKRALQLAACGGLLGIHWVLFYASIQYANVSIGVVCYALVGFFTAIVEPLVFHKKFSPRELVYSLITVAGLLCIFSLDSRYRLGIAIGSVAAFTAAVAAIFLKKYSQEVRSRDALAYQMMGGFAVLTLLVPLYLAAFTDVPTLFVLPQTVDLMWIFGLSLFCTVALYLLQIAALKTLPAFTVELSYNLEPIYTICMAFVFFGEGRELNFSFYLGIGLVVLSVLLQTQRAMKNKGV